MRGELEEAFADNSRVGRVALESLREQIDDNRRRTAKRTEQFEQELSAALRRDAERGGERREG